LQALKGKSAPPVHTASMGYNPYRKHKATTADYLFLVAAALVATTLIVWGFFG
jgi:energy-coupling factor transporter transmembrane protein EcfT